MPNSSQVDWSTEEPKRREIAPPEDHAINKASLIPGEFKEQIEAKDRLTLSSS
jgi:hypothetical protein